MLFNHGSDSGFAVCGALVNGSISEVGELAESGIRLAVCTGSDDGIRSAGAFEFCHRGAAVFL